MELPGPDSPREDAAVPDRASDHVRFLYRVFVAGLGLAVVDLGLVLGRAYGEFLAPGERFAYVASAIACGLSLAALGLGAGRGLERLLGRRGLDATARRKAEALVAFVFASPIAFVLGWSLTAGRRVKDLPLRPVGVAVFALAVGALLSVLVRRRPERASSAYALVLGLGVPGAALADTFVLPRLYPAFHVGLAIVAIASALLAVQGLEPPSRVATIPRRLRLGLSFVLGLALVAATFGVYRLAHAPNAGFVVEQRSPVVGKLVKGVLHLRGRAPLPQATDAAALSVPTAVTAPGIDLRDKDILLVTVDALRYDRLRAYGGHGLTPAMDALASEGAVFRRAYTPTPHTSYALASLITGKYLRPVLELPDAPREHATMPDLLRRYGYRTAAFYPPAIFFVDAHRFGALAADGFGFEYRKEMFAPASERVAQVRAYLADVPRERPVFVWVHLFEPHEPYDPPPAFRHGESAEARYDGEVRAADAAIGELVRTFRETRPGATVILGADHGEEFGDHGGHYHGSTLYDEQVRIPLVWSSPGVVEPRTIDAPVELVDVATTILGAVAIPRDARMRGDDLGPLLRGSAGAASPRYAFADIADARMITDGRWKAICRSESPECQLFDLVADPHERRNEARAHRDVMEHLRGDLYGFLASIPRVEAMAMAGTSAWPPALARAELGDATVGSEVQDLLGDPRPEVRAAAARAIVRLRHRPAIGLLGRLAGSDPDPIVRAEVNVALLVLGERSAIAAVTALLADETDDETHRSLRMRAAFALGEADEASAAPALARIASDEGMGEDTRRRAVETLGRLRSREVVPALVGILGDVRLRPDVCRALAAIGDPSAIAGLGRAFAEERYVPAREAEARALVTLGDRSVATPIRRYLGMETGLPGGLGLLLELGRIRGIRADSGDLRAASGLAGLACDAEGCRVGEGASLPTSAPRRGSARLVVRVVAEDGARLRIGSRAFGPFTAGAHEVSVECSGDACSAPALAASGELRIVAYAVVPSSPEIPPPPPVPWDGGADGPGAVDAGVAVPGRTPER